MYPRSNDKRPREGLVPGKATVRIPLEEGRVSFCCIGRSPSFPTTIPKEITSYMSANQYVTEIYRFNTLIDEYLAPIRQLFVVVPLVALPGVALLLYVVVTAVIDLAKGGKSFMEVMQEHKGKWPYAVMGFGLLITSFIIYVVLSRVHRHSFDKMHKELEESCQTIERKFPSMVWTCSASRVLIYGPHIEYALKGAKKKDRKGQEGLLAIHVYLPSSEPSVFQTEKGEAVIQMEAIQVSSFNPADYYLAQNIEQRAAVVPSNDIENP